MKKRNNTYPSQIAELKHLFGGNIIEKNGVYQLKTDNSFAKGTVTHYTLSHGTSALNFNITFNTDVAYTLGCLTKNIIHFAYCVQGACYFKSQEDKKQTKIEELQPSIFGSYKNKSNQINIKQDSKFVFTLISVDKDVYFKTYFKGAFENDTELEKLYKAFETLNSKIFKCSFNLKIADYLRVIDSIHLNDSIANILKIDSNFQYLLAIQIELFYKEKFEECHTATLSKFELQKIRQITEYIVDNPEVQHSISTLCAQVSMSPAKLQEGFKSMHNTTVADFIRNVRVEKAEKLLTDTDLNISEIVYTIGLTSRSYFCKIFKQKYSCSPKRYRKKIRTTSTEVNL